MRRSSKPSSRESSRSSSSRGSEKDYTLTMNLYGRGDGSQGDPPAHWGTMIHKRGEKTGDLYHVTKNDDFKYDPRAGRPVESVTSWGRSEIKHLSSSRKERAERVLHGYGNKDKNLPQGDDNCQNWTVGALGALEDERLAPQGTSAYWKRNIGKSSKDIGERLQRDGKSWIPKPGAGDRSQTPADATYGKQEARRPTGRLNLDKFANLSGPKRH